MSDQPNVIDVANTLCADVRTSARAEARVAVAPAALIAEALRPCTVVYALVAKDGRALSMYFDQASAEAKRDRYNADPFLEPGHPDPDAPYLVEAWSVKPADAPSAPPRASLAYFGDLKWVAESLAFDRELLRDDESERTEGWELRLADRLELVRCAVVSEATRLRDLETECQRQREHLAAVTNRQLRMLRMVEARASDEAIAKALRAEPAAGTLSLVQR